MRTPKSVHLQKGFSLIEIMVGLAIGMATVIIMMQMLSNAEASKRISAGGNDAQTNATMALYSLERDIRASGYGMNSLSIVGCNLSFTPINETGPATVQIAPTAINPPNPNNPNNPLLPLGDAHTDTLLLMYGNGDGSSEGDPLVAISSSGVYQTSTPTFYQAGNVLIAQNAVRPSPTCTLGVDSVTALSGSSINVNPGVSGLPVGSLIFNLGNAPVIHAYAIRNGNLTMCDYTAYDCSKSSHASDPAVWVQVASNVVALRAEYGHDNTNLAAAPPTMTGVVGTYDQTTPGSPSDTSGLPVYCSWARAMSVRVAVVARSNSYDKSTTPSPTQNTPTWSGSTVSTTVPTNPAAVTFDLSGNASWQQFRYKTLETTVPLRNAIWQGGQTTYQGGASGC